MDGVSQNVIDLCANGLRADDADGQLLRDSECQIIIGIHLNQVQCLSYLQLGVMTQLPVSKIFLHLLGLFSFSHRAFTSCLILLVSYLVPWIASVSWGLSFWMVRVTLTWSVSG